LSRRKDRERFLAMQAKNRDYTGFRGSSPEEASTTAPMDTVTCSQCGRKRNVAAGVAVEHQDDYICATCLEEAGDETAAMEGGDPATGEEEVEEGVKEN